MALIPTFSGGQPRYTESEIHNGVQHLVTALLLCCFL